MTVVTMGTSVLTMQGKNLEILPENQTASMDIYYLSSAARAPVAT